MARIQNPIGAAAKFALLVLTAVGVVGVAKGYEVYKKKKKEKTKDVKSALSGIFAEGATIGAQPGIAEDVLLPVSLGVKPRVRDPVTGAITESNTATISTPTMLYTVVTDLSPEAALQAYEIMLHLVANKHYDMSKSPMRDQAVNDTLAVIAPKLDWSKGLEQFIYSTGPIEVWNGVKMLAEIAHQSYWNKQAGK